MSQRVPFPNRGSLHIEKLASYVVKDNSIEMVQGRYLRLDEGERQLGKSDDVRITSNDEARRCYLTWRTLNYAIWNKLLKRSFVLDNRLYNKEGIIWEDLHWTFYLIKHLSNAKLCSDVTYYYHIRPGSIVTGSSIELKGRSYEVIFDEILHNLTPGKEREELKGYQTTFCSALAEYLRGYPDLKTSTRLYKKAAKQYGCWSVYFTVTSVALVSHFCNPLNFLRKLNDMRLKVKRTREGLNEHGLN